MSLVKARAIFPFCLPVMLFPREAKLFFSGHGGHLLLMSFGLRCAYKHIIAQA